MMKRTSAFSWAAAGLLLLAPAVAAAPGQTSSDFLNIGLGPRAVAMGGAFTGLADDASSIYWNPAGLAQLEQQEASFSHTQWVDGIGYEYLLYAYPTERRGTVAGSYSSLNKGGIPSYDETGAPLGSVGVNDSVASAAWGGKVLEDKLSLGLAGKAISESLAGYSAHSYAADLGALGTLYEDPFKKVTAGLSIRNLGQQGTFVSEKGTLPRTIAVGVGFKGLSQRLSADLDGVLPNGQSGYGSLGAEYWIHPMVAIRAGYQSGADVGSGFSAGVGIRVASFFFDYSFSDMGALGLVNRGGITYRFGSRPRRYYEEGLDLMREGNYSEAFLRFNKLLSIEPDNRAAVMRMKECRDRIQQELKDMGSGPPSMPGGRP